MSRAVIRKSNYDSSEAARTAIDRHFAERNAYFLSESEAGGAEDLIAGERAERVLGVEQLQGPTPLLSPDRIRPMRSGIGPSTGGRGEPRDDRWHVELGRIESGWDLIQLAVFRIYYCGK